MQAYFTRKVTAIKSQLYNYLSIVIFDVHIIQPIKDYLKIIVSLNKTNEKIIDVRLLHLKFFVQNILNATCTVQIIRCAIANLLRKSKSGFISFLRLKIFIILRTMSDFFITLIFFHIKRNVFSVCQI